MSRRYLLVDDNVAFAENLAEILREEGADVSIAHSGAAALELIRHHRFDVLVTDMRMPAMNGAQLVHQVRRADAGLPAIVVSAYSGDSDLRAAWSEGLLAVLPKPVPVGRLLELVARARRGGLVALVEDDPAFAENIAEVLRERGFSTITARSIAETSELASLRPFLALADLRMPLTADGEPVRRLHAQFPWLHTFIVTAYAGEVALPTGVPVFEKPCDTSALLGAIEREYEQTQAAGG